MMLHAERTHQPNPCLTCTNTLPEKRKVAGSIPALATPPTCTYTIRDVMGRSGGGIRHASAGKIPLNESDGVRPCVAVGVAGAADLRRHQNRLRSANSSWPNPKQTSPWPASGSIESVALGSRSVSHSPLAAGTMASTPP
jgi:hypothetical protein